MSRKQKKADPSDDPKTAVRDLKPERNLLERIIIKGLHGLYDYDIELAGDLTFLHSPNGVGKTTIFRLLTEVSGAGSGRYDFLFHIQFSEIALVYSDGWKLRTLRHEKEADSIVADRGHLRRTEQDRPSPSTRGIKAKEIRLEFALFEAKGKPIEKGEVSTLQEDEYESGSQIFDEFYWKNRRSRSLEDRALKKAYGEAVIFDAVSSKPYFWRKDGEELPVWDWLLMARNSPQLKNIHDTIAERYGRIFFLGSERLSGKKRPRSTSSASIRHARQEDQDDGYEEKQIEKQSRSVADRITRITAEIGANAMNLGSGFVKQTLKMISKKVHLSREEVQSKAARLQQLNKKVSSVLLVGEPLTVADSENFEGLKDGAVELVFLDLIYDHLNRRYEPLEDFFKKEEQLTRMLDERFASGKKFQIGRDGFEITLAHGQKIGLDRLSSGEEHQVVTLYWLLFEVEPRSIVLIDEPEISLHPSLQRLFAGDMETAIASQELQVIAATHSPEIVGRRKDCAVKVTRTETQSI
jgi:ABC-type transport system involved in cytochrome c biogenesis ATPase subunit